MTARLRGERLSLGHLLHDEGTKPADLIRCGVRVLEARALELGLKPGQSRLVLESLLESARERARGQGDRAVAIAFAHRVLELPQPDDRY